MMDIYVVHEQFRCQRTSISYSAFSAPEAIIAVLRRNKHENKHKRLKETISLYVKQDHNTQIQRKPGILIPTAT